MGMAIAQMIMWLGLSVYQQAKPMPQPNNRPQIVYVMPAPSAVATPAPQHDPDDD